MTKKVVVRLSPSPTGFAHSGFLKTGIVNYLFAKANDGKFIMRIEDTDQTRFVEGAEENFLTALKWVGIEPEEHPHKPGEVGPYRQSERLDIYLKYGNELYQKGLAYWAFDTQEEIKALQDSNQNWCYGCKTRHNLKNSLVLSAEETKKLLEDDSVKKVLRFKVPENQIIIINDLIRGKVTVNSSNIDDKVLIKSDGWAAFHLANLVDDHLMGVTHVFRGEEWLPSTPFHALVFDAFGWDRPNWGHLPLILKPNGDGKLSKRDGAKYGFPVMVVGDDEYSGFIKEGYIPDAVFNYFALLGYYHPGENNNEIYSREEIIKSYDISRISKAGARFNIDKLKWFNSQYLKAMDINSLVDNFKKECDKLGYDYTIFGEEQLSNIVKIASEGSCLFSDMPKVVSYLFNNELVYEQKSLKKWSPEASQLLKKWFESSEYQEMNFDSETIETTLHNLVSEEITFGNISSVLRISLVGSLTGPKISFIMSILGKEKTKERYLKAVASL